MAISFTKLLQLAPGLLTSLLPGLFTPGGALAKTVAGSLSRSGLKGAAFDYPAMTEDFDYPINTLVNETWINGKKTKLPALNSGLDPANAEAALVQTLQEHNKAVASGNEKDLIQWWPGEDNEPRVRFNPTSSAIDGLIIDKDGSIKIKWVKGNKWYTYRGGSDLRNTTDAVKELLTYPSIGRALARGKNGGVGGFAHADSRDLTGKPKYDPNIYWWGNKYYEHDKSKWGK
ncbi:MAG: hypothetical protein ABS884_13800 [Solibacillus isronensis]